MSDFFDPANEPDETGLSDEDLQLLEDQATEAAIDEWIEEHYED